MNKSQGNMIRWLHLSDFHIGTDDYGQRSLFMEILDHVRQQKKDAFVPDLIFITGDVAYNGKSAQYKVFVSDFLLPLNEILGDKKHSHTFVVPGNHDVFRETHKYFDREATCKGGSRFFDPTHEGMNERQQIFPRFKSYAMNRNLTPHNWINTPGGSYAKLVKVRNTALAVLGINTAWLSLDENDRHKLSPGINLLKDAFEKLPNCSITIVLGHHPIEWFRDDQRKEIETILGKHNALYFHGHLHENRVKIEGDGFLDIQSGAAFVTRNSDKWVNGLMWGKLDLARGVLSLQPRQWNWRNLDWPTGKDLPEKNKVLGTDWWEFSLPGKKPSPKHVQGPSELSAGIQPSYHEQAGFIGRNHEIQEFKQFLGSEDLVLNFHGISGIGKSWLLNHLLKALLTGRIISDCIIATVDCKEIDGDLFEFMRLIARNTGEKRLPLYISKRNKSSENFSHDPFLYQQYVEDMWDMLFSDLQTVSKTELLIIFIDSFEKVQGTTVGTRICTALKNYFGNRSNSGLKVVIGSQEPINASKLWVRLREVEIRPFSNEELVEFVENILSTSDKAVIDYLADAWKGDPLELGQLVDRFRKGQGGTSQLLAQLRSIRPECVAATDSMILKGLRERLGDEDMGILSYCAVPRWFDASVIRAMDGSDVAESQSLIKRLSQWWFIKPRTRGGYEIHERYRGPLLRSLIRDDIDMFSKWSERCYEYLQSNETNMGRSSHISREIESVYYLMTFNPKDALVQYNDLRYSFGQGKRLDLMMFLQDTIKEHIDINPYVDDIFKYWIDYGHAELSYISGNQTKALSSYNKLLKLLHSDVDDLKFLRARVLSAKGYLLYWKLKNKPGAMKCFEEAIGLWRGLLQENIVPIGVTRDDIVKSIAETHVVIARIEEIAGSLLEGMKHFHSALETYQLSGTLGPSYGETLRMIARNLRLQGKWDEAHRRFNEAEEAFNAILKDATLSASHAKRVEETKVRLQDVRNARAAMWKEEGKWKEAKEVLKQVIGFHKKSEEIQNPEALGIAQIDLGDVLRMEGNFIEAKQIYKEAKKSLSKSNVNKGYPLLGLAEVAAAEGKNEEALKCLSKAEKAFLNYNYTRKLGEVGLCKAKIARRENLNDAIATLEKTWERISESTNTYVKSAVLVELTELVYEAERDSERYKDYHMQAMKMADQEQRLFSEHLARLNFIDGRKAGEEDPFYALHAFIKALAWAVRHNILTLQIILSQAVAWLKARPGNSVNIARERAESLAREAEAEVWQSEEIALSTLPEESQKAFKDTVEDLTRLFVQAEM